MELLSYALKKVKSAEVYEISTEETSVLFSANKLKEIKTTFSQGIALRVISNGKIGFASTTNLKNKEKILSSAIASSEFGEVAKFEFPPQSNPNNVDIYDKKIENLSFNDMIKLAKDLIKKIREKNCKIHIDAHVGKEIRHIKIMNSSGMANAYSKTTFVVSLSCLLTKKDGLLQIWEASASCSFQPDILQLADKVIQKIDWSNKEIDTPTKKITCIFAPKSVPSLLEPLRLAVNGKLIQKNISPLVGKINEKLFSSCLNIHDDATIPSFIKSSPFDDEGVPSRRNTIIKNGYLKNILCDLQTASLLGIMPSSSGRRRSISSLPSPDVANIVIEGKDISVDKMIKDIKEGILIDQLIGWAGNPLAGEFSGNVELGFKIERGEITSRVKNCVISGNVYHNLNCISNLSKEREIILGTLVSPYIQIEDVSISGKK